MSEIFRPVYQPPIDAAQEVIDVNRESRYEVIYDYVIRDGAIHPIAVEDMAACAALLRGFPLRNI